MAAEVRSVLHLVETRSPELLVLELNLHDGSWRDVMVGVPKSNPVRTVILTARGSIASAVSAVRMGAVNYLLKPVTVDQLIWAVEPARTLSAAEPAPLSLDRAIWEFLCQAVETSGSIAGAARMLRIHRRSLRRMLQKNPPNI